MSNIRYEKRLVETPSKVTRIYRLRRRVAKERSILQIAKRFGLKGERNVGEILKDPDELTYREGQYVNVLYKKSGAIRYYDSTRWQIDDGKSEVDITDTRAISIARKFIRKTGLVPLGEVKLPRVTRLHVGTAEIGTGKSEERVIDVGVVFGRTIDKLPVEGPGGRAVVYIDHNEEVTGFDLVWREVESVERDIPAAQLRPPKYAEESLWKYWQKRMPHKLVVEDMRFGYFELGREQYQLFLQPAYIMPIELVSRDPRIVVRDLHVVPAALKPAKRIMPVRRKKPIEPKRS
ncbi:MAG: hypothetical protein ACFFFC_14175 [Candidatus Thorarchaeota archaeon]